MTDNSENTDEILNIKNIIIFKGPGVLEYNDPSTGKNITKEIVLDAYRGLGDDEKEDDYPVVYFSRIYPPTVSIDCDSDATYIDEATGTSTFYGTFFTYVVRNFTSNDTKWVTGSDTTMTPDELVDYTNKLLEEVNQATWNLPKE